jgi:hypothetical protein
MGIEKFENELNNKHSYRRIYDSEILSDGSSKTPIFIKSKT